MNSQFKNSNLGFYLYAFIIAIIVIASIFVFWYMLIGYKVGTYSEDTMLGSVYIGGLREEDVIPKMDDRINTWYNDQSIFFQIEYQDYTYELDRNLFFYDLELSVNNINDGGENPVYVSFQASDREAIVSDIENLPYLDDVINNVDVDALISAFLDDASAMKSFSTKNVEDYLITPENSYELIDSAMVYVPETIIMDDFLNHIEALYPDGRITIEDKMLFDVVTLFGSELSDTEMSLLSSAMLATIDVTNFQLNELHYRPYINFARYSISNYPLFGRNVSINRVIDEGFSFYNPNESTYYFKIEKVSETEAELSLYGLPFAYDIETNLNITEIDYITQTTTNPALMQIGYNGVVAEVERTITDVYGDVIIDRTIVFEFYPPVKEIVLD
jgi:hypothetical protein